MKIEEALYSILEDPSREKVDEEMKKAEKAGIRLIPFGDEAYPLALTKIHDAPKLLYVKGDMKVLDTFSIAVVGARKATTYGKSVAMRIAGDLAYHGVTIVSGMAYGVDSAAHAAAIGNGKTVAVLGNGLDIVYPRVNLKLFNEIQKHGCVVSEFPFGTRPQKWTFPKRNRIIVGLSRGVVVIEAAKRSGSLITAHLALEEGREVFAVPGSIFSKMSEGANNLIKSGAKCVLSYEDVLDEFGYVRLKKVEKEDPVLRSLKESPKSLEELRAILRMPIKELSEKLTMLEVEGKIVYDSTGKYILTGG